MSKPTIRFHQSEQYHEEVMNKYKSLENLIRFNGGNFKSMKQARFLQTWAWGDMAKANETFDYWGFIQKEHYLEDGEYIISIDGWFEYGEGEMRGRGKAFVPFSYLYVMDKHGVKRVLQLKYKRTDVYDPRYEVYRVDGWSPASYKVKWEREEITFHPEPEKPKAEEPKAESQWVGEVGKRYDFKAKVIYSKDFETAYGWKVLYLMVDEQGNKLKTFYSGTTNMWKGCWYTFKAGVKNHDEYKGEKVTELTRLTKITEVEG